MQQPQPQQRYRPFQLGADGGGLHCARTGVSLDDLPAMFGAGKNELVARTKDTLNSGVKRALQFREHFPGFREAADTLHMEAAVHDQAHEIAGNPNSGHYARLLHSAGSFFGPNRGSRLAAPPQGVQYT